MPSHCSYNLSVAYYLEECKTNLSYFCSFQINICDDYSLPVDFVKKRPSSLENSRDVKFADDFPSPSIRELVNFDEVKGFPKIHSLLFRIHFIRDFSFHFAAHSSCPKRIKSSVTCRATCP